MTPVMSCFRCKHHIHTEDVYTAQPITEWYAEKVTRTAPVSDWDCFDVK